MIPPPQNYINYTAISIIEREDDTKFSSSEDKKNTDKTQSNISIPNNGESIKKEKERSLEEKTSNTILKNTPEVVGSQEYKKNIQGSPITDKQIYGNFYIEYNVKNLIFSLKTKFNKWKEQGTSSSYSEISEIKNLLEEYAPYMEQNEEASILLGTLELLFQNNNWEQLTPSKLSMVVLELDRFGSGEVSWDSLTKFSQQLWAGKVIS
jgi:hypothetical protein